MMRILHFADLHLDGGPDTEPAKALNKIAAFVVEQLIDVVHVNGDIFDSTSKPLDRLIFKRFVDTMKAAHKPVVILRGNHDEALDLSIYDDRLNDIYVVERPESIALMGGEYRVFCIPHFHGAKIAAITDNQREFGEVGTAAFDDLITSMWNEANLWAGQPMALVAHAVVSGAQLDNGFIPRANGIHLSHNLLNTFPGVVMCGHYHKFQDMTGIGKVYYSGSPCRHTFAELSDKGFVVVEYEQNGSYEVKFHSLDPRPMFVLKASFQDGQVVWDDPAAMAMARMTDGADIKIDCTVAKTDLAAYKTRLQAEGFENANRVKIEPDVVVSETVRCAAIEKAETVADGVRVWLENTGTDPVKVAQLLALLHDIVNQKEAALPETPTLCETPQQPLFALKQETLTPCAF